MQIPGTTPIGITPDRRTSTLMASGVTSTTTAMSGIRMSRATGLRIATETGCTSLTTGGRGWAMSRGVGLLITMGVGCGLVARGDGGLVRLMAGTVRSGRLHMSPSGDGEAVSDLGLDLAAGAASAGSRLDRATGSIRGGVDTAGGSAW